MGCRWALSSWSVQVGLCGGKGTCFSGQEEAGVSQAGALPSSPSSLLSPPPHGLRAHTLVPEHPPSPEGVLTLHRPQAEKHCTANSQRARRGCPSP